MLAQVLRIFRAQSKWQKDVNDVFIIYDLTCRKPERVSQRWINGIGETVGEEGGNIWGYLVKKWSRN